MKTSLTDEVSHYAQLVVSGQILAGPFVRMACEKHLKELELLPRLGYSFSVEKAARVFKYFRQVLRLPKTADEINNSDNNESTKPFELELQQKFVVGSLFGWLRPNGYRRFRIAYIETGKGSGKSPMAAGIGLYMLTGDKEQQAEIYSAAPTRDVAKILFRDANMMVDASPKLDERLARFGKSDIHNIVYGKTQSFFKPISAEGRALDGKRVHGALIDEVHEHPNATVVDKLVAGLKGRMQPLVFMITNSGIDVNGVCYREREYSINVLKGILEDYERFSYICALDEGDDWQDPKCWQKANPLLGVTIQNEYLERQVREAIGMPAKQNIVRRLNFCEWVGAEAPWISHAVWKKIEKDFSIDELKGEDCYIGLDLSGTRDLSSVAAFFPKQKKLFVRSWVPAETLDEKTLADRVPYRTWVEQKHLETTPGKTIRYSFIAQALVEMSDMFNVLGIAFDEYRIKYLEQELHDIGAILPLVKHPQGFRRSAKTTEKEKNEGKEDIQLWMPQSVNNFEAQIIEEQIHIKRNPVVAWAASCTVLEADAQGNRKFAKHKATGRIDPMVAAAQAIGLATEKFVPANNIDDFIKNPIMIGVR